MFEENKKRWNGGFLRIFSFVMLLYAMGVFSLAYGMSERCECVIVSLCVNLQ